jgi:hypothetical protein
MNESKFLLVKKVTQVKIAVILSIVAVAVAAHSSPKTEHHFVLQEEAEVFHIMFIQQFNPMRAVNQHNSVLTLELDKQHLKWVEREQMLPVVVALREMEKMDLVGEKEVIHS